MEKVNAPKYTMVCIYTKKGNLLPYFTATVRDKSNISLETLMRIEECYAAVREIQLIAMFRWEQGKCFCKIKCPVNPLPVKGEFECPSIFAIDKFLKANGWTFKQKVFPRMFIQLNPYQAHDFCRGFGYELN